MWCGGGIHQSDCCLPGRGVAQARLTVGGADPEEFGSGESSLMDAVLNLVMKQYTVKGPVMLMLTTTAIDVDEELLKRCLVLTVNESREQTERIHAA